MKEISFLKTQWLNILVGAITLVAAFVILFQVVTVEPAATATNEIVRLAIIAVLFFTCSVIWLLNAVISYNALRVEQLQKRIEILEACAITDIVEESPKYYVVKRRLGPDKEVPNGN
jgi:predicted membrane channel-forming protein YqfA (hemolysin III family)